MADPARTRVMRAIHAAVKSAGADEDDRKAVGLELTGKRSMSDMSMAELEKVRAHWSGRNPRPAEHRPHVSKMRALWWSLYWLGEVHDNSERALSRFVHRMTQVDSVRFLTARQSIIVIEALRSWATRAGVNWPIQSSPHQDRLEVAKAIWRKLYEMGERLPVYMRPNDGDGIAELDHWMRLHGAELRALRAAADAEKETPSQ